MKSLLKSLPLVALVMTFSCKKETPKEEPEPTPAPSEYSTFTPTLAVVDYTAPGPSRISYSANLSVTTTAMAYIIADGVRIDSLPLNIKRVSDLIAPPTITWSPSACDKDI